MDFSSSRLHRLLKRLRRSLPVAMLIVALALVGCGGDDEGGGGAEGGGGGRIAFGFPFRNVDVYKPLIEAAKEEADKRGYELLESSAGTSASEQLAEVNTWISSGVDAIVLFALEPDTMAPVVERAQNAGIKVIGYGEHVPGEDGSIVFDNQQGAELIGTVTGEYINEELGGEANVAVLSFPVGKQNRIRSGGAVETIQEVAPDAEVVAEAKANDAGTALEVSKPMLASNPDIDVVVGNTDDNINGFAAALESVGKQPDSVWFASYDASTPILKKMLAGDLRGVDAALPIPEIGRAVVSVPDNALTGEGPTDVSPEYQSVTPDDEDVIREILSRRGAG